MSTYRNGTYVAFDGQGDPNPCGSDLHNFELLKAWQRNEYIDFNFINSHEKTYNVKDTSSLNTLKTRLKERMANSKNMLIIVSKDTNKDRGLLNWEIEQAVEIYHLPLIVAYVGLDRVTVFDYLEKQSWFPKKLAEYCVNNEAKIAHIPFMKENIRSAINHFSVVSGPMPINSTDFSFG